jgi:hypothetical protein
LKKFLFTLTFVLSSYTFANDHKHHVALFTGATHSHELSYGTFGLDYEYKFSDMWGVGGLYEKIQTDPSTTVVLLQGSFHLDDLMLTAGIGKEENHGHSEGIKRIGAAYHFHVSSFSIAPSLNYDFIDDGNSAVVYGILWGVGF